MPRCNIRHLVNRFANAHAGKEVTSKDVAEWVEQHLNCTLKRKKLEQYLRTHPRFELTSKGRISHYLVVDSFDHWLDSLKML